MINHGDMIAERIIERRRCRLQQDIWNHSTYPYWVADTGDYVAYSDEVGGFYCPCRIFCDYHGPFLIERNKDGILEKRYIKSLVLNTFGPAYDGMKLFRGEEMINHKDGNWMNCDYRNLEIAPYHYRNATSDRSILFKAGAFLEVFSGGSIWVDGVEMPVFDWWYFSGSSFIDNHYSVVEPYIIINGESIWMEEIMKEAGFIQGDNAGLKEPAILHIDGNYMNFAAGNLMWVRKRDPRYNSYIQQKNEAKRARERMLNGD